MTPEAKRRPLGRGLAALLGADPEEALAHETGRLPRSLPTSALKPGRFQPRRNFDAEEMASLVRSIAAKGILQPILVRPAEGEPGIYEIIAGERRWRAAQEVPLHEVPVSVHALSDAEALETALIENIQREDLNPLEEAEGYQRLMIEFSHTQEDLAKVVGKSRSHVANMMRLLGLPQPVKALLATEALTAGHARALLNAPKAIELAGEIVKRGLNVRQTERLVKRESARLRRGAGAAAKDADTLALERDLSLKLGLKVGITHRGGRGALTLHYATLGQLDDLVQRLLRDPRNA